MISITIKQKLIVLIIIKIVAFSSILYIGGNRLALNSKQLSNIQSMYYPVMNSAEINNVKLTQLSETFDLSVTLGDDELLVDNRNLLESIYNEFNNQIEHQNYLSNEVDNLKELTGSYFDSADKLALLMINGDISLSDASLLSKENSEKLKELKILFNSFSEQRTSDFERLVSEIEHSNNITHGIMRVVGIISFVIILFLFIVISNYIKSSLFNITKKMKDIAEGKGDLTERLTHVNKDELYELVYWFNLFISNLQKNVSQTKNNTHQLSDVSTTLVDTSEITKELSYKQYKTVDEVTVLLSDLFTSVKNISSNAFDTSHAANNANKEAKKGELQVQDTIKSVHELTSEVHSALVVIQELNTYTHNASSILDSINSIAEQTNLLALNAAIEAARAGKKGAGFAVVADEVRTLALRTKTATQDIHTVLELLQSQATKAVNMISNSGEKATLCAEQSKISELSLQTITSEVNQITQRNKIIATLAGEQESTSKHIQVFIDDIHKMSEKTTENTNNIDSVSHEVELITLSLTTLNNQFKVS